MASRPTFTQWMNLGPSPGNPASPQPGPALDTFYRNLLDRKLAGDNRTPEARYPDGYMGTVTDRRQGKLDTGALGRREGSRGVHKGEMIDTSDYYWPDEWGPFSGIQAEARGERQVPALGGFSGPNFVGDSLPTNGLPRGAQGVIMSDPRKRAAMERLAPKWRMR